MCARRELTAHTKISTRRRFTFFCFIEVLTFKRKANFVFHGHRCLSLIRPLLRLPNRCTLRIGKPHIFFEPYKLWKAREGREAAEYGTALPGTLVLKRFSTTVLSQE